MTGFLVAACASPNPTPEPRKSAIPIPTGRPIDPAITPVSVSDPFSAAGRALRDCLADQYLGPIAITGIGRIPHARDAVRYVPLTGLEPEIQTDDPAWIITYSGEVPMLKGGEDWIDPTCIVVAGHGGFYATGPVRNLGSGVVTAPVPPLVEPDLVLPSPLP